MPKLDVNDKNLAETQRKVNETLKVAHNLMMRAAEAANRSAKYAEDADRKSREFNLSAGSAAHDHAQRCYSVERDCTDAAQALVAAISGEQEVTEKAQEAAYSLALRAEDSARTASYSASDLAHTLSQFTRYTNTSSAVNAGHDASSSANEVTQLCDSAKKAIRASADIANSAAAAKLAETGKAEAEAKAKADAKAKEDAKEKADAQAKEGAELKARTERLIEETKRDVASAQALLARLKANQKARDEIPAAISATKPTK